MVAFSGIRVGCSRVDVTRVDFDHLDFSFWVCFRVGSMLLVTSLFLENGGLSLVVQVCFRHDQGLAVTHPSCFRISSDFPYPERGWEFEL